MQKTDKIFKYEKITQHIKLSVKKGILPPGVKVPSLRTICSKFNCSMSVAMQAYRELEMQNVIESVEKSGFFVRPQQPDILPSPQNAAYSLTSASPKEKPLISKVIDLSNDRNIISLAAGIPDTEILPIQKLNKIITQTLKGDPKILTSYTTGKGSLSLRKAISSFLFKKGVSADPEEILITNGCMEALSLAIRATTKEGDIVAIENPVFFGLINLLRQLKRKVIEIPTSITTGMDLDVLEKVVRKNNVKLCLVTASFQNPLSFIMPEANKERIAAIAKKFNFIVIEDDIYSDTSYMQKHYRPITSYDKYGNVLYCSSFSKSISPGMRIGWLLPKRYTNTCENIKFAESLGGSQFLQESMARFLNEGGYDYFIKNFRKNLSLQVHQTRAAVLKHFPKNIKISSPEGGYFLWMELPKKINSMKLFEAALKKNICIVPGTAFSTTDRYRNCIRISAAAPFSEKTENAIKILSDLISNI